MLTLTTHRLLSAMSAILCEPAVAVWLSQAARLVSAVRRIVRPVVRPIRTTTNGNAFRPAPMPVPCLLALSGTSVVLSAANLAPLMPTNVPVDAALTYDRVQPHDSAAHIVHPVPAGWDYVETSVPCDDAAPATDEAELNRLASGANVITVRSNGQTVSLPLPLPPASRAAADAHTVTVTVTTDDRTAGQRMADAAATLSAATLPDVLAGFPAPTAARKSRAPRKGTGRKPGKVAAQAVETEVPAFVRPARVYSDADIAAMDRKGLQAAAKRHGIKANATSDALRAALAEVLA